MNEAPSSGDPVKPSTALAAMMKRVRGALVVFCLSWIVFSITAHEIRMAPAWRTFEFCQYAEIGRNLATRGEYLTNLVEPMALAAIDAAGTAPSGDGWPVVNRYPLPAFANGAIMAIFGATDLAAAASNGLAISLLAALIYYVAQRWLGCGWAILAAALFLANPSCYGFFVLLGTPDIWFALAMLWQLLAWITLLNCESPKRPAAVFGVATGVAYLARFNVTVFFAIQLLYLIVRKRWRDAALAAMTALVVMSPAFILSWVTLGRPFASAYSSWNLLDGIGAYKIEPWLYYEAPSVHSLVLANLPGIFDKFANNIAAVVPTRIWTLWHMYLLLPLALAGCWRQSNGETLAFVRWGTFLFFLQLVVFSFMRLELEDRLSPFHGRYFFWYAPIALVSALGLLKTLSVPPSDHGESHAGKRRIGRRLAIVALVAAIQFACFADIWRRWIVENRKPENHGSNIGHDVVTAALTKLVGPGRVVASNQPQILVWYGGLRAISLPADPAQLARINSASKAPVDYIYISTNLRSVEVDPRWYSLFDGRDRSSWKGQILRDYEYALPPERTSPIYYVILRRRSVEMSAYERELRRELAD